MNQKVSHKINWEFHWVLFEASLETPTLEKSNIVVRLSIYRLYNTYIIHWPGGLGQKGPAPGSWGWVGGVGGER